MSHHYQEDIMNEKTPQSPALPTAKSPPVLGELTTEELNGITNLKQQADRVVHQLGINRVQEHRLMDNLRRMETGTNQIIQQAGKRLGIPEGTPWSVTQDGKAVLAGPPPAGPSLVPDAPKAPEGEVEPTPEG
jgi:hypothetical protein